MLQFKCCHFFKPRNEQLPPPALESNTWPTYNFHLRFFQVHHYQKKPAPLFKGDRSTCPSAPRRQAMSQLPPRTVGQSLRRGTSRRLRRGRGSRGKDETPRVPIGCQANNKYCSWQNNLTNNKYCSWRLFFQTWKGCGEWVMIVMALWRLGPPEIKVKLHVLKTCFVGVLLIGPPRRHLLFVLFATHNSAGCASDYSGERWSGVARGAGQESLEHRRGWRCE